MIKKSAIFMFLFVVLTMITSCKEMLKKTIIDSPDGIELRSEICDCMNNYKSEIESYGDTEEYYEKYIECVMDASYMPTLTHGEDFVKINIKEAWQNDCWDTYTYLIPYIDKWNEK